MISLCNYMAQVIHHVRHIKINTTTKNYQSQKRKALRELHVSSRPAMEEEANVSGDLHSSMIVIYSNLSQQIESQPVKRICAKQGTCIIFTQWRIKNPKCAKC